MLILIFASHTLSTTLWELDTTLSQCRRLVRTLAARSTEAANYARFDTHKSEIRGWASSNTFRESAFICTTRDRVIVIDAKMDLAFLAFVTCPERKHIRHLPFTEESETAVARHD